MKSELMIVLIVSITLNSCSELKEKHFRSTPNSGETYVQLDLEKDGTVNLIRINHHLIPDTLGYSGHWRVKNGTITCLFKATGKAISKVFSNNSDSTYSVDYNFVRFDVTTDTLIICGQRVIPTDASI